MIYNDSCQPRLQTRSFTHPADIERKPGIYRNNTQERSKVLNLRPIPLPAGSEAEGLGGRNKCVS